MNTVIVTNQAEWDALPHGFPETTVIEIRSKGTVVITTVPESSRVVARGSSSVKKVEYT